MSPISTVSVSLTAFAHLAHNSPLTNEAASLDTITLKHTAQPHYHNISHVEITTDTDTYALPLFVLKIKTVHPSTNLTLSFTDDDGSWQVVLPSNHSLLTASLLSATGIPVQPASNSPHNLTPSHIQSILTQLYPSLATTPSGSTPEAPLFWTLPATLRYTPEWPEVNKDTHQIEYPYTACLQIELPSQTQLNSSRKILYRQKTLLSTPHLNLFAPLLHHCLFSLLIPHIPPHWILLRTTQSLRSQPTYIELVTHQPAFFNQYDYSLLFAPNAEAETTPLPLTPTSADAVPLTIRPLLNTDVPAAICQQFGLTPLHTLLPTTPFGTDPHPHPLSHLTPSMYLQNAILQLNETADRIQNLMLSC